MGLKELTDKIYYLPHEAASDRPMLAYLKGSRFTLAVDAGYSENHVRDFYNGLEEAGLPKPDFTVITHWHYDHTFGMCSICGVSIAQEKTNLFLKEQQKKLLDPSYIRQLKKEDPCFEREYRNAAKVSAVLSDIQFQEELCLSLGGMTAKIYHTEAPHSEDTVCIYVPEEKVLFLGDATSEDFFNNGYMDRQKLRKLVEMIENTDCVYCILSHTEPLEKGELVSYLHTLLRDSRS